MTRLGARRGLPVWARALLALLLLALLAVGGAALYLRALLGPAGGAAFTLEVKPGDTLGGVARTLQERGVVQNADVLRFVMRRASTASPRSIRGS